MTSNTDKALKGFRSQTAIVIIKGIASLIFFAVMSRLLTPDDFGYFALITAVTTIMNSLSEAGLGSAVIQKKDPTIDYTSTAFTLSVILGLFFSILLFSFASFFSHLACGSDNLSLAFRIMSSMISIQAANNITWALYMRKLDFFKFGILQVSADILSYGIGIIFALRGYGFYSIIASTVSTQIFLMLILIILKKYRFRIVIRVEYLKEIVNYGGWLTAAVILRNLTNEIDKVIIGRMLPIAALGEINRPQGFVSRISGQVNGIFDTVLFPIISSIQGDRKKVTRAYMNASSLVVTLSLLLGASMALGAEYIIKIFFGSQWIHLQTLLIIFSMALMIHGWSRVADSFFRSLGIVRLYFLARLINWIVIITLVWTGCHFGIMGVAIASVTGSAISCLIKFFMQRDAIGIGFATLSSTVLRNIWLPLLLFTIGLFIKYYAPYGYILGLSWFILSVTVSIIFFPGMWGHIFKGVVIDRYLKRFSTLRIY